MYTFFSKNIILPNKKIKENHAIVDACKFLASLYRMTTGGVLIQAVTPIQ